MKISTLSKPALLIYEIIRVLFLALVLVLEANSNTSFIMTLLTVQSILYPIMALFLCLNTVRFREYLPLFIAGKSIGIITMMCWSLLSRQNSMIGNIFNEASLIIFDLFALAAILIIRKDVINLTENVSTENNLVKNEISTEEN